MCSKAAESVTETTPSRRLYSLVPEGSAERAALEHVLSDGNE